MLDHTQPHDDSPALLAAAEAFEAALARHDQAVTSVRSTQAELAGARARLQQLCHQPGGPGLHALVDAAAAVDACAMLETAALVELERARTALNSTTERFRSLLRNYDQAAGGLTN